MDPFGPPAPPPASPLLGGVPFQAADFNLVSHLLQLTFPRLPEVLRRWLAVRWWTSLLPETAVTQSELLGVRRRCDAHFPPAGALCPLLLLAASPPRRLTFLPSCALLSGTENGLLWVHSVDLKVATDRLAALSPDSQAARSAAWLAGLQASFLSGEFIPASPVRLGRLVLGRPRACRSACRPS